MAHGPLDDPVDDQQLYSDVEEELLEKATQKEKKKKKKKGSSRSVNVSTLHSFAPPPILTQP